MRQVYSDIVNAYYIVRVFKFVVQSSGTRTYYKYSKIIQTVDLCNNADFYYRNRQQKGVDKCNKAKV